MTGALFFPEMTGQGAALFDFDGDGDLDAYLIQGAVLGDASASPSAPGGGAASAPLDRLYRNDSLATEAHWVDWTMPSGLRAAGYGMAVATGDIDGDGWLDLLVANYGPNELWRNAGNGSFVDVTDHLDERQPQWTTAAVFFDYDRDGRVDLYLVNYVHYDVTQAPACYAPSSRPDYCGPSSFKPQPDRLLHNRGEGRFLDVTAQTSIASLAGPGLGVALLDATGTGELELFVANDGQPNYLWRYRGGRWIENGLLAGVAVNGRGAPEASMGTAVADFDRDGDEDLFVTHLAGETNTLYVNEGAGLFGDRTIERGLAGPSLAKTAFGAVWLDLDHDGWLDLAIANGAVRIQEELAAAGDDYPLGQSNQIFRNREGRFEEVAGSAFSAPAEVSRGLVGGDVDNDGDRDLLLTNSAGPTRLFLNQGATSDNWVGVSLTRPAHQQVVARSGETRVVGRASSAGSYASSSDPRVVFAGPHPVESLTLALARGKVRFVNPPAGRYLRIGSQP